MFLKVGGNCVVVESCVIGGVRVVAVFAVLVVVNCLITLDIPLCSITGLTVVVVVLIK